MTIGLCRLVVINTASTDFADATAIYATLNQLVIDVISSRSAERIVDRYGAGCTIGSTRYRNSQMVCFSYSRQLIEVEKLRGFCQVRSVYLEEEVDGRTNALAA